MTALTPAEFAPQKAIWTAWPSLNWPDEKLATVRREVGGMVLALAETEKVKLLAAGTDAFESAAKALEGKKANIDIIGIPYGDVWLRDTGPIFGRDAHGRAVANCFRFNGWGEKFIYEGDEEVGGKIAAISGALVKKHDFILEGGSVDMDGEGTCLTTRQCLLNKNRNKGFSEGKAEAALRASLGVEKLIWIDEGLAGDHTDGHIDNIARFVAPGMVVCQSPSGGNDPNAETLVNIEKTLRAAVDAKTRKLNVVTFPGPGLVTDAEGDPIPASHMNFIIGNKTVVVPVYNEHGVKAVHALAQIFPTRKIVGVEANTLLTEGGSFHCITQQEPL